MVGVYLINRKIALDKTIKATPLCCRNGLNTGFPEITKTRGRLLQNSCYHDRPWGYNCLNRSFFNPPELAPGGCLYLQGLTQAVGIFYRCGRHFRHYLAIDFLGGFLFIIHSEKPIYTNSKEFFIFF